MWDLLTGNWSCNIRLSCPQIHHILINLSGRAWRWSVSLLVTLVFQCANTSLWTTLEPRDTQLRWPGECDLLLPISELVSAAHNPEAPCSLSELCNLALFFYQSMPCLASKNHYNAIINLCQKKNISAPASATRTAAGVESVRRHLQASILHIHVVCNLSRVWSLRS